MRGSGRVKGEFFSHDYFYGGKISNYFNYEWWDNPRYWRREIQWIEKFRMGGRVVDVGCAFGFFLKRVSPYFQEVCGVDISRFALEKARKSLPQAEFFQLDVEREELPFPDFYFDLLTAFDVLEHTYNLEDTLRKLLLKVKKGGFLMISLPLGGGWIGRLFTLLDRDLSHVSLPSEREFMECLEQLGVSIVDRFHFLNLPFAKIEGIPQEIEVLVRK